VQSATVGQPGLGLPLRPPVRHIPSAGWDEVASQAEWVCDHWDQPDEGIWESACCPSFAVSV